jgi:hypothetical protein
MEILLLLQDSIKSSCQIISSEASSRVIEDSYWHKFGPGSGPTENTNSNIGGRLVPIWRAGQGIVPAREMIDGCLNLAVKGGSIDLLSDGRSFPGAEVGVERTGARSLRGDNNRLRVGRPIRLESWEDPF